MADPLPNPSQPGQVDVKPDYLVSSRDSRILPATHVSVNRIGDDVVSTFVFDDGSVNTPLGLSVVQTLTSARLVKNLVSKLQHSGAFKAASGRSKDLIAPPRPYTFFDLPSRVIDVMSHIIEQYDVVFLTFIAVDPVVTLAKHEHRESALVPPANLRVSLNTDAFVAWLRVVEQISGDV